MRAGTLNRNSKVVGQKTKTMKWKTLKCFVKLRVIILCVLVSDIFHITHSYVIHLYSDVSAITSLQTCHLNIQFVLKVFIFSLFKNLFIISVLFFMCWSDSLCQTHKQKDSHHFSNETNRPQALNLKESHLVWAVHSGQLKHRRGGLEENFDVCMLIIHHGAESICFFNQNSWTFLHNPSRDMSACCSQTSLLAYSTAQSPRPSSPSSPHSCSSAWNALSPLHSANKTYSECVCVYVCFWGVIRMVCVA